ncbi:4Fe-4S binding protein [Selenomonas sp.]|uniref:4Fe-4S binding protein n=1 Tax=Selenomonas sp. TaxID=2053611 RepID=UPI0025D21E57|nr:4Fe-4S binding protein [Selenomonas sp.]
MARREIDLNRCLFHYTNITCNRCQEICPQNAIHNREIDREKCNDCGLCTAVCPTGALQSSTDYDSALTAVQNLTPQVLMCQKVASNAMPCLGAINRRLLWALAEKQPLAIDTSRCSACNPAVHSWLEQEIKACNQALSAAGKAPIKLVHVKDTPPPPPKVARRSFFRSLFHAASDTATEIAQAQTERQFAFDPVIWLSKQAVTPCPLFPSLTLHSSCTACGLCTMLCPEKALQLDTTDTDRKLRFHPLKCTACSLCVNNCPQGSLKLLPRFNGLTEFPLEAGHPPISPANSDNSSAFNLQRG